MRGHSDRETSSGQDEATKPLSAASSSLPCASTPAIPEPAATAAGAPTIDRLLDTAAHLFWEKGYAATTTREIAQALDIRQASLYYHIASKEDLLHRICVSSLTRILNDVPAAVKASADNALRPLEELRVLIRAHVSVLLRFQKRNVTMLTELRSLSGAHRKEVVALREKYTAFVRSAIQAAQAAGEVRADIPAGYLSLALLNLLNWSALWFHPREALSSDQLAEIFIQIFLEGAASAAFVSTIRTVELPDFKTPAKPTRARKLPKATENKTGERLLDAAVALFSKKGYAATSTREVAEILGIQKASLYYHIESKDDLLYLISKSSLEQIHKDVEAALQPVSGPLDRIQTLFCAHIESMLRDRDEHTTTLAEMRALSKDRLAEVLALRHGYEDLVRSVLRQAQNAGALRSDVDAKYLCLGVLGLMNRVLVWYRPGGRLLPVQLGHLLAEVFLAGAATPAGRV